MLFRDKYLIGFEDGESRTYVIQLDALLYSRTFRFTSVSSYFGFGGIATWSV